MQRDLGSSAAGFGGLMPDEEGEQGEGKKTEGRGASSHHRGQRNHRQVGGGDQPTPLTWFHPARCS